MKKRLFIAILILVVSLVTSGITLSVLKLYEIPTNTVIRNKNLDVMATISSRITSLKGNNCTYINNNTKFSLCCKENLCLIKVQGYNPGAISSRTTVITVPAGYRPPTEVHAYASNMLSCAGLTAAGGLWIDPCGKSRENWLTFVYPRWS